MEMEIETQSRDALGGFPPDTQTRPLFLALAVSVSVSVSAYVPVLASSMSNNSLMCLP